MTTIIGISVENRQKTSKAVQDVLTKYGCEIKTRLGINDYKESECTYQGMILVDVPKRSAAEELIKNLESIQNVTVKSMEF